VETHPEVISQLVATAKRLPGGSTIPIIRNLLKNHDESDDPDIPLQVWWALESKSVSDRETVVAMFRDPKIWSSRIVVKTILGRLVQRWVMEGGNQNYTACATLLKMAPSAEQARPLMNGIEEGLRGRDIAALPVDFIDALKPFQSGYGKESMAIALRQGQATAIAKALEIIADEHSEIGERLFYIRIFGEINQPASIPVLLRLMERNQSTGAIKQASLEALSRYDEPEIGARVTKAYPDILRADPYVRNAALSLLTLRSSWATQLLNAISRTKQPGESFIAHTIDKADVPESLARHLRLLNDPSITETVKRLWPAIGPVSSSEKSNRINRVLQILQTGSGNQLQGHAIFKNLCGSCHRLFGEGADIGPDLTGYDRKNLDDMVTNIIDPNAYIREGYGAYHITTTDNRSLVGTLKGQSGSTITIQPFNGEVINLGKEQIKEMVEQKISIMPEGLLNALTDQQVRDLISYVTKVK
jgi:putative heme-binding domain-containing protein